MSEGAALDLPSLLVIVGPTASGKSALAARLGAALGGEVISADSVQVYRHFDIGAGKPSEHELTLCAHHLIGIRDPGEVLEASAWAELAAAQIAEVLSRGKRPIICGGTFLWIRALLFGLADAPAGDEQIRERHRALAETHGRAHLHELLRKIDAKSAERLHENDLLRVSRALEVYELSGRPLSEIQEEHGFSTPRYTARLIAIDWPVQQYEARLQARVQAMIQAGLVEEVRRLIELGYGASRAMGSVGYRQVYEALTTEPTVSESALIAKIVQVTRIFVRRQRTWLRDENVELLPATVLTDDDVLREHIERLKLRAETSPLQSLSLT